MKPYTATFLAAALTGWAAALAQTFDPGSDGSFGDYVTRPGVNTIVLPADGVLRCRTFTVQPDHTVVFAPNKANTPVWILATGDIVVQGLVDVSGSRAPGGTISGGLPGPGGFRGGNSRSDGQPGGAGFGPGGGQGYAGNPDAYDPSLAVAAGPGGYRSRTLDGRGDQNGAAYGTPTLIPLVGGSGGGGGWGAPGGGGGGAILMASATRVVVTSRGEIRATGGGGGQSNGGSGGAIRLVGPEVSGGGVLDVSGQDAASLGRIRLDAFNARVGAFDPRGAMPAVGSLMLTGLNLSGAPRLAVVQLGALTLVPGESGTVSVTLPAGSNPNQNVVVEAANFGRRVPVAVALIPDHGPRVTVAAEIDNASGGVTRTTVPVTFPLNVTTRVAVWTR
jgi:hypothetical protein